MNEKNREFLLKLARQSIEHYLAEGKILKPENVPEELRLKRGVFVTLTKNERLRGCIGYLEPVKQLAQAVCENAFNAAFNDCRFPSLEKDELEKIRIEISVLTVPKPAKLEEIQEKRDGVILINGYCQSTFLPQVWQQIPEREEFFSELSMKAGLNADGWKDEKTKFLTYQVEEFHE